MFNGKTVTAIIAIGLTVISAGFGQSLEDNWIDFLHYIVIGKYDLAKGYGQVILQSNPDPVQLFALSKENKEGYSFLLAVVAPDSHLVKLNHELVDVSRKVLSIVDQGRFMRRSDPNIIVEEIRRLMEGTERGRLTAVKRLRDAGEYAIPYVLDALADRSLKQDELANIVWGLPQIGRPAIRPLVAALQTENAPVKAEIIRALGKIGYPQSLAYLQYVVEKDDSPELQNLAGASIRQIDRTASRIPAAVLFFRLAEQYYYEAQSLAPAEDAGFGNVWFWDSAAGRLTREEVDKNYFCELMAMRTCEWALKADPAFGNAIGLWLAAFLKAETAGAEKMPAYFGDKHADALVYATTAGPEYLHQALARAIKDKNADVALGAVEALATTAGEKSLFYALGPAQPLLQALSFDDRAVRYSAAIAVAAAGPRQGFAESKLVIVSLADALGQNAELISETPRWNQQLANSYALRAAEAMLKLAETRNPVIDLSVAQSTLVSATQDERREIQVLAGQILARLASPDAQRAIAAMALNADNDLDVRILAFESLATSAKINAYMLTEQIVDAIYVLISSDETEPDLRAAAAAAYGALNLPSRKVKDLILDQAKS